MIAVQAEWNGTLEVRQGLTSQSPLVETLTGDAKMASEYLIPADIGFFIRLRGRLSSEFIMAIAYSAFSYTGKSTYQCSKLASLMIVAIMENQVVFIYRLIASLFTQKNPQEFLRILKYPNNWFTATTSDSAGENDSKRILKNHDYWFIISSAGEQEFHGHNYCLILGRMLLDEELHVPESPLHLQSTSLWRF